MVPPVLEFFHLILKLKDNRPFMVMGRLFMMSMVALAAIGCAGQWIVPLDYDSLPCVAGKFECYQGPPLSLSGFVFDAGASRMLFALPVLYVLAALVLTFAPERKYLVLLVLGCAAFVVDVISDPQPYVYTLPGIGKNLHMLGIVYILILSIPLAISEQVRQHPDYDYEGFFKYFRFTAPERRK